MRVKKIDDEEEGTELTEDEIMGLSQGFHVILVHIHVIILAHVHIIILVHVLSCMYIYSVCIQEFNQHNIY